MQEAEWYEARDEAVHERMQQLEQLRRRLHGEEEEEEEDEGEEAESDEEEVMDE